MGLPDIALYYKAMVLVRIMNWCHDASNRAWVLMEGSLAGRNLAGGTTDTNQGQGAVKMDITIDIEYISNKGQNK